MPIISKAFLEESYCTDDIFEEGAYIIEGISGGNNFTIDIFVKVPIIFEGIPGGDNYTGINEQEDCNPTEDLGVEAKKVCQV